MKRAALGSFASEFWCWRGSQSRRWRSLSGLFDVGPFAALPVVYTLFDDLGAKFRDRLTRAERRQRASADEVVPVKAAS